MKVRGRLSSWAELAISAGGGWSHLGAVDAAEALPLVRECMRSYCLSYVNACAHTRMYWVTSTCSMLWCSHCT